MATPVIGRNIMLYWRDQVNNIDVPFACALDGTLSIETETKEITSQSSAWVREFKPNLSTWNINISGLVILNNQYNYLYQLTAQKDRQTILVKFVIDNGGVLGLSIFQGNAIILNNTINSPDGEVATYQCTLQGSGPYSLSGTTITPGGTTIISGTIVQVIQTTAASGTTAVFPGAIGLDMLYCSRGGVAAQPIGSLVGNGVTWNPATATATFASELFAGEALLGLFQ
jgi:hypothetical protein